MRSQALSAPPAPALREVWSRVNLQFHCDSLVEDRWPVCKCHLYYSVQGESRAPEGTLENPLETCLISVETVDQFFLWKPLQQGEKRGSLCLLNTSEVLSNSSNIPPVFLSLLPLIFQQLTFLGENTIRTFLSIMAG